MTTSISPGLRLRNTLKNEQPLQIVGVINAHCAMLAQHAGFQALYVSGAGVANAAFGLPDLGVTTLTELTEEVRRITNIAPLPVVVDADTGFGNALMIERTVRELAAAGAAGLHIEDQIASKRCGHRPNKELISKETMSKRIQTAVNAKPYKDFVIIARTDAIATEGIDQAIERAKAYVVAGADWIFAEAVQSLADYQLFTHALSVPVLANITEFGKTPLFTREELSKAGVKVILYPLSAFRAMNKAALTTYETIRQHGTQVTMIDHMQTRDELYQLLNYWEQEKKLEDSHERDV